MDFDFEIKRKDIAARVGRLKIGDRSMETPALMPVYNPQKRTIPIEDLAEEFGAGAIMANAYMLYKDEDSKKEVLDKGIHDYLGYDGIIATDSGSYQLMVYGAVDIDNKDIIEFEEGIGTDIGSFLDIPSHPDAYLPRARQQLETTLERSREAENAGFAVNAAIQGAKYPELRAEAAKSVGERFKLVAVGGIVPLMEAYRFDELVHVIMAAKKALPADRVVHAFGLGHPMLFPLAALMGCDLFDSAAYALYAQAGRYMTDSGTEDLDSMEHIFCCCPVCSKHGIGIKELFGQDRVEAVARHNLYVSFDMIGRIKHAIKSGRLWELVAKQARSHPKMMAALTALLEHSPWMAELDPITKPRAMYHTGAESQKRPEVINAKIRLDRVGSKNHIELAPFGQVNDELLDMYPFNGVFSMMDDSMPKVRDIRKLRAIMEYQFGPGAGELIPADVIIKRSRKTKRIRWLYHKGAMLASVRASDHFILPHEPLLAALHAKFPAPRLRIRLIDDADVVAAVRDGRSAMCKFVADIDPDLRPGDECLIVDCNDRLIRGGQLHLAPREVSDFTRGMAARAR